MSSSRQTPAAFAFTADAPWAPDMADTWWRITAAPVDEKARKRDDGFIGGWVRGGLPSAPGWDGRGSPLRFMPRQIVWT
jgi:hypothetical protein